DLERALAPLAEFDRGQLRVGGEVDFGQQLHRAGVELVQAALGLPEVERRVERALQRDAHVLEHAQVLEHGRDLERADDAAARDGGGGAAGGVGGPGG